MMKKILIIAGAALCSLALAAPPARAGLVASKGFKLGLAIANMSAYSFFDEARVGSLFGGYATFKLTEHFFLQPELLFVEKGIKSSGRSGDYEWKDDLRLTYLEIPILAKYSFEVYKRLTLYAYAGPALALKVGATEYWEYGEESGTKDLDEVRRIDFGLTFGEGAEISVGRDLISLDIRYTQGLINCFEIKDVFDPTVKNGVLMILVGLGF
jgi:opacity protein-like surface antigen